VNKRIKRKTKKKILMLISQLFDGSKSIVMALKAFNCRAARQMEIHFINEKYATVGYRRQTFAYLYISTPTYETNNRVIVASEEE
jgi:hypothetical protein